MHEKKGLKSDWEEFIEFLEENKQTYDASKGKDEYPEKDYTTITLKK